MCSELPNVTVYEPEDVLFLSPSSSDSNGHIEPEHIPFWHLGAVASSFVMLNESTEDTLYNMAQVANITQLVGYSLGRRKHLKMHQWLNNYILLCPAGKWWRPAEVWIWRIAAWNGVTGTLAFILCAQKFETAHYDAVQFYTTANYSITALQPYCLWKGKLHQNVRYICIEMGT